MKRKLMGESLFLTYFPSATPARGGFAGAHPGCIQAFDLAAGHSVLVQRDAFLCAWFTLTRNIALVKKIGAGPPGGIFRRARTEIGRATVAGPHRR